MNDNNMDVLLSELKRNKDILEGDILKLLNDFMYRNNVNVIDIEVETITFIMSKKTTIDKVTVELEI